MLHLLINKSVCNTLSRRTEKLPLLMKHIFKITLQSLLQMQVVMSKCCCPALVAIQNTKSQCTNTCALWPELLRMVLICAVTQICGEWGGLAVPKWEECCKSRVGKGLVSASRLTFKNKTKQKKESLGSALSTSSQRFGFTASLPHGSQKYQHLVAAGPTPSLVQQWHLCDQGRGQGLVEAGQVGAHIAQAAVPSPCQCEKPARLSLDGHAACCRLPWLCCVGIFF